MIENFRHKGLERLYEEDTSRSINTKHVNRLKVILARLDAAKVPADMDFPGSGLHPLKGKMQDFYAVKVSGNWRITFRFCKENVCDVDYVDYH